MADRATELLRAAQDGDPTAFGSLVALTRPDIGRYCAHLAGPDHAEDLVQETYLRALRSLQLFRGDSSAARWLIAIARRVWLDHLTARRRGERPELTRRAARDLATEVGLLCLLEDLPPEQRDAFVLTAVLGYAYDETAAICGVPVGTVRSRVARARRRLVQQLHAAEAAG